LLPAKSDGQRGRLLPAKPVSPLPAKPNPLLPACSQRSQIVREVSCSQRSQFHPYQRSWIHLHRLAPSEASFTPTSDARSTATRLLPAKSDCQRGKLLPAKPVSPLPAKPNPLLPACSQRSHFHPYQRCRIHRYQLAPSKARLPDRWEWACQSGETMHVRALNVRISELREQASQLWKWACQVCGSELVKVVGVSLSELWECACQSCWSKLVGVMGVRVDKPGMFEIKESMLKIRQKLSIANHEFWWLYSIIHELQYIIHTLQLNDSNNTVVLSVNYSGAMGKLQVNYWGYR